MSDSQALTPKQEAFCQEYLKDLNATQSAIRAGYSPKTAAEQSSRLLSNVKISERVRELSDRRMERVQVDADYVLKRLVEIDEMDVLDILLANGEIKPVSQWPKVWRTSLSGIDVTELAGDAAGLLKKIKWPDKVKNLELLGKHIHVQAFKEQVSTEVSGPGGGPLVTREMSAEEAADAYKDLMG